jgi:hypothetical protein
MPVQNTTLSEYANFISTFDEINKPIFHMPVLV